MKVYFDDTERFISPRRYIKEIKALFYQYWLLRYPLKHAPTVPASTHFRGYINLKLASISKVTFLTKTTVMTISFAKKL